MALLLIVGIILVSTLFISVPNDVFATSLENTELNAENDAITLDIKFGQDEIKTGFSKTTEIAQLESIHLSFHGDEIILSEPKVKVTKNSFRIFSISEGILIFGHKNIDSDNYDINLYFVTGGELTKFSLSAIITLPENEVKIDSIIETESEIKQYVPELKIISSLNPVTYRGDTFNMDIQAFDGKINPTPKNYEFAGRLDGVDITVVLSLGDEIVTTLKGITSNNGHWDGEHYFGLRSDSGEYDVDILASYGDQTVSKIDTMIVSRSYSPNFSGGDNNAPVANAGPNQSQATNVSPVSLDGSGSSDSDGDTLTYRWIQTGGTTVNLTDSAIAGPTFPTPAGATVITFELTVTDPGKRSSADTVTITITEP